MSKSNKVRALKRFVATNEDRTDTRWFNRGEVVPAEFLSNVKRPGFVDQPIHGEDGEELEEVPFPEFGDLKKVDEILAWVDEADDYEERVARARHALQAEEEGQQRKTLLDALPEFIVDDEGEG